MRLLFSLIYQNIQGFRTYLFHSDIWDLMINEKIDYMCWSYKLLGLVISSQMISFVSWEIMIVLFLLYHLDSCTNIFPSLLLYFEHAHQSNFSLQPYTWCTVIMKLNLNQGQIDPNFVLDHCEIMFFRNTSKKVESICIFIIIDH